ncbi:MFS transporter [Sphingomonas sp.]|uniref:MFS transporter n=1 Tax=Sphingomonas sp. TaxID=28214 RepID=UPI003D6CBA52
MNAPIASASADRLRSIADHETGAYKWYVAAVLGLAHTIAVIDRFVMVLVTEPIRAAMQLSDTQLGLLQGTGFAILYCGFAVPLGCVADATNRRNLIMAGLSLWSLATIAAAFTTSFETLFATRILVGMGEACLIPAGMSLLATYFAPANLARGTSIFGLGANFGYGFAFLGGGAILAGLQASGGLALPGIGRLEPWQGIFLIAGAAAVPVLIMLLWLREPPRRPGSAVEKGMAAQLGAMREGFGYLWANLRSYAPFLLIGAMTAVTGYAMTSWSSSLFVRVHAMSAADAGKLIGLIGVIAGPLGTISGGYLLDRLRGKGVAGAPLIIMAGGAIVALLTAIGVGYAPSLPVAAAFFCLFIFESTFVLPSLYVGMQLLTPDRYRGVAASFNMMIYTLAGLGLGPTAVGAISDHLTGSKGLAEAVVIVEVAMVLIIVPTAWLARRRYDARMRAAAA